MAQMSQMRFQPAILIPPGVGEASLKTALVDVLGVPTENVFRDATPEGCDYGRLFSEGYFVLHAYRRGAFGWMAEGFLADAAMGAGPLQALSARLSVPVCVDRGESGARPNYVAYLPDRVIEGISVAEHEDADGEVYLTSKEMDRLRDDWTA